MALDFKAQDFCDLAHVALAGIEHQIGDFTVERIALHGQLPQALLAVGCLQQRSAAVAIPSTSR